MVFLIEYDRQAGKIVTIKGFKESDRKVAEDKRLETELNLNTIGSKHEVVILEADNKNILRRTHARYFRKLKDLAKPR